MGLNSVHCGRSLRTILLLLPLLCWGGYSQSAEPQGMAQWKSEVENDRALRAGFKRALGLERSHLYKKCQALGIDLRAMRGGQAG